MADDIARATAAPPTINLGGLVYRVAKQGPRIHGELQQAIKAHFPDPRLMARDLCRDLPDAVAKQIWTDLNEEAKDWPPAIDSWAANQFLTTTAEGAAAVVWALLRRHNPQLDQARAREIAEDMTSEQVAELVRLSMPEPDFRPKDAADPTTTDPGPPPS